MKNIDLQKLAELVPSADQVRRNPRGAKLLKGFFYCHGQSSEKWAESVSKKLKETHTVIDHGEAWYSFKGGAPLHKQSHFWIIVSKKS